MNRLQTFGSLVGLSSALAFVVGHGSAIAADCSHASCADPAWVTACSAAEACKQIDGLKTTPYTTKRSYTPASGVPDPSTERDVRALGPKLKMRKRPVAAPHKVVTPYTPAKPNAAWASGPGAPPVVEFDRRGLTVFASKGGPVAKSYDLAIARFRSLAAIEDATTGDPGRAKEDAAVASQQPAWVGDPRRENYRAKTSHWPVSSCAEYGYKKEFEYMWFHESALALGDYRLIYDLAMRADSPVRLRNRTLHSYGPPDSPFQLREDWGHHDLTIAKTNLMLMYSSGSLGDYDATPWLPDPKATIWDNHAKMEEARRAVTDDEFADIERRQRRFADLVSQLWAADFNIAEQSCKQKGYPGVEAKGWDFECLGKPGEKGPGTSKGTPGKVPTVDGASGGSPPPLKHKAPPPRPIGDAQAQASPRARQVATKSASSAGRAPAAAQTLRQVQGLVKLNKTNGANPPSQNGSGTTGGGSGAGTGGGPDRCAKKPYADRKVCYLQAAADAIQHDIDAMIAFEKTLPESGCLNGDPLKNRCNWSYKGFAEMVAYARPDLDDARTCAQRIPDWGWLTDRKKQDALIAKRVLYATDGGTTNPPIDYTSDITRVDAFIKALDDAPNKWADYDKQRVQYLKWVATITEQTKSIPGVGDVALGESKGDGFDLGHPETFGAGAHYALSWGVTAVQLGQPTYSAEPGSACAPGVKCCNNIACGIEERICRFNGAMSASADAKAFVFGSPEVLLDAAFTAYAEDDAKHAGKGAHMDAHFTFLNSELFPPEVKSGIDASSTGTFTLARPLADTSGQIPDPPISVAFMVGPIPVTLEAGSVVSAGVDLSTTGIIGDTCSQKNVPPPFSLTSTIAPRAKADAFGQAGVDLVAVSAGVRVDLNLLTLGLPVDVGFKTDADNVVFDTRADLVANALAGSMSLFAEVRYVVGSDTYETQIFSWPGVQGSRNLFDYNKGFPLDALSYRFYPPQAWRKL